MSSIKKAICNLGHKHVIQCVMEIIYPYYCNVAEAKKAALKSQGGHLRSYTNVVYSKNNKLQTAPKETKNMKQTEELHNDSRQTVVLIGEKVYELVLSETWNKNSLASTPPTTRPHVRSLNAIPARSKAEQDQKNKQDLLLHKLTESQNKVQTPLTKAKNKLKDGGSSKDEVEKLIKLKAIATAAGDHKEVSRIRKALRKMDYKRYTTNTKQE